MSVPQLIHSGKGQVQSKTWLADLTSGATACVDLAATAQDVMVKWDRDEETGGAGESSLSWEVINPLLQL